MPKIEEELLKLSTTEKIILIEKIWDSINHDQLVVMESHKTEVLKRLKRFREGKSKFYSWDEVRKDLRS